jgi:hypothetical protein
LIKFIEGKYLDARSKNKINAKIKTIDINAAFKKKKQLKKN